MKLATKAPPSIAGEDVVRAIVEIRGCRVLLDEDLAALYGVATKALLQAVRRNRERFPHDFLLELTDEEWAALRSQSVTLDAGRGKHRKYKPFAFTEQGVAMLSSVLRSPRAIAVDVQIMRAFVRMRQLLSSNQELATRLIELESRLDKKLVVHDEAIAAILSAIRELLQPPASKSRGIGFTANISGGATVPSPGRAEQLNAPIAARFSLGSFQRLQTSAWTRCTGSWTGRRTCARARTSRTARRSSRCRASSSTGRA
jgi:hypothetical protein